MEACKLSLESCTLRASDTACIKADPGCAISWALPDASCCRAWFGWRNGSFSKVSEESVEYGPQQNARLSQSSDSCHVPLPRVRGPSCCFVHRTNLVFCWKLFRSRVVWNSYEACAAVGNPCGHHPVVSGLQVWQAPRLSSRLVELPDETTHVLRPRKGFAAERPIPARL